MTTTATFNLVRGIMSLSLMMVHWRRCTLMDKKKRPPVLTLPQRDTVGDWKYRKLATARRLATCLGSPFSIRY